MKTQFKWIVFWMAVLTLVGILLFAGSGPVAAAPLAQMTPGVDPMTMPTVAAPALDAQNGFPVTSTYTGTLSGQTSCPMMSGSAGTVSGMSGMGGMSGMSGMGGMSGMSGMGGMSGMSGMGGTGNTNGMSGMSGMPGYYDDALSNSQRGFFYTTNPWQVVGWIVVFIMLVGLLAFMVLGILWMVKQILKEKPAASA